MTTSAPGRQETGGGTSPGRRKGGVAGNLGVLLAEQGDVAGAKAAYQQAIESEHADVAPWAAVNLGLLLAEQGDVADAKAAWQQAIESGHADAAPSAAFNLGLLLEE